MLPSETLIPIPPSLVEKFIGKTVHVSWAKPGCHWKLIDVMKDFAYLETPTSKNDLEVHITDLLCTQEQFDMLKKYKII